MTQYSDWVRTFPKDWSSNDVFKLLNRREQTLVAGLDAAYRDLYHVSPTTNPNLVYFLGDRLEWGKTWSAHSGKLPTFRRNKGFYLLRNGMKIMSPTDKLAALGWPVTQDIARSYGVTVFPSLDLKRGDLLAGNSMHLGNSSVVLLLGLACFGRVGY